MMHKSLKRHVLSFCCLLLSLGGCDLVKDTQKTAQEAAGTTVGQIKRSEALSDLTLITAALNTYHMQNSSYPKTIEELKLKLYHPQDLEYDPTSGKIRSKTYPDL